METSLIVLFSVLGVYYFSGILTYLYIYAKNINRNRVYLNATLLRFNRNMETDLDSIIEISRIIRNNQVLKGKIEIPKPKNKIESLNELFVCNPGDPYILSNFVFTKF